MVDRDDQKRQIQDSTDIVRLVGEQVAIKPRGKEFIGLCPFHEDHSPSMYVSPVKQIYKCFSCGAGGDVFAFVMNYHKMTFPEALKYLADRAGIELVAFRPDSQHHHDSQSPTDRKRISAANVLAVEFYQALLRHPEHGKVAREYIQQRGISADMVEAFQLGYAADRWDGLAVTVDSKKWDKEGFEKAGLIGSRREGPGFYDRLRHRLIFPISDALGRPIAFGGRKLRAEDEPKYLNSPETDLFNKSATLYGLHLAKKSIIDTRVAVIVEGYTDVIACHQAGVSNVVATLGTALTAQHVMELRRYAQKVVLVYDGDVAGQKAADRALEVFLTGSLDVAIAVLPDGLDPADLLSQEGGKDRWAKSIANATDALAFQLGRVQGQLKATDTVTGRETVIQEYLRRLAQMGLAQTGSIRRSMILAKLSDLLNVGQDELAVQLKQLAPSNRFATTNPSPATGSQGNWGNSSENPDQNLAPGQSASRINTALPAEAQLVGCLLREPDLFHQPLTDGRHLDEAIVPEDMTDSPVRELYSLLYDRLGSGEKPALRELVSDLVVDGRQDLADLATTLEHSVEQGLMNHDDKLPAMLVASAQNILRYHMQREHKETRQQLMNQLRQTDTDVTIEDDLLRKITEQRRANPSTIRIARFRQ